MGNVLGPILRCVSDIAADQQRQRYAAASVPQGAPPEHLRAQADALFKQRNAAFEQSKACYARGDHAGAKHYSNLGKDLDAQAKAVQKQAASMIYEQKNQGRREDEIDLHGLTVNEAEARVEAALKAAKARGQDHLIIITGKGLHSGPGGPKIKPAITRLINEHHLRCTVGKPNDGCLYVEFVAPEEAGWFGKIVDDACAIM